MESLVLVALATLLVPWVLFRRVNLAGLTVLFIAGLSVVIELEGREWVVGSALVIMVTVEVLLVRRCRHLTVSGEMEQFADTARLLELLFGNAAWGVSALEAEWLVHSRVDVAGAKELLDRACAMRRNAVTPEVDARRAAYYDEVTATLAVVRRGWSRRRLRTALLDHLVTHLSVDREVDRALSVFGRGVAEVELKPRAHALSLLANVACLVGDVETTRRCHTSLKTPADEVEVAVAAAEQAAGRAADASERLRGVDTPPRGRAGIERTQRLEHPMPVFDVDALSEDARVGYEQYRSLRARLLQGT